MTAQSGYSKDRILLRGRKGERYHSGSPEVVRALVAFATLQVPPLPGVALVRFFHTVEEDELLRPFGTDLTRANRASSSRRGREECSLSFVQGRYRVR